MRDAGRPSRLLRFAGGALPGRLLEAGGNAGSRGMTATRREPGTESGLPDPPTPLPPRSGSFRFPPPLEPGDAVGVAALSGPVDAGRLEAGMAALARLGFDPRPARNLASRHRMFAGDDASRLAAFHELADDPEVRAIFFARGGHGLLRLLPGIDWNRLARVPRAWVGYSDLTPFVLAVVARLGLVAFHGPMVATDLARGLEAEEERSLLAALAGGGVLAVPLAGCVAADPAPVRAPLLGGCLSLLQSTLGTPWQAELEGSLLALEDVAEPLYRIDRMLTHLRLSGSLAAVRGIVLGAFPAPDPAPLPLARIVESVREHVPGVPIAWGAPMGHAAPNWTLPLGAPALLDPAACRLVVDLSGSAR